MKFKIVSEGQTGVDRAARHVWRVAVVVAALFAFAAFGGELGSAEDNIPDASNGVMPVDKVMEWMENAVDPGAWEKWRAAHPAPSLLFGEDRQYAVRNNIVSAHWIAKGNRAAERFHGVAQPGEFYPFQVCVFSEKARRLSWNAKTDVKVSRITPETCDSRRRTRPASTSP